MQLHDEAGNLQGLVKILRDMTEAHQARERERFLSESSAVLAGTLDYKTTLFNIARLAVPFLADFCFFDILNSHHQVERVAWHHSDPTRQDWFEKLQRYTPPTASRNHPITHVLNTGNANLVSQVTEEWTQATAIDADHLQFIQESQVRSLITVPLIAHGRTLGALTVCLTAASSRCYTQTDLVLAEELGRRAALALDNAQLYHQAQESNRLKDEFMAVLSHELRSPLNPILGWLQMIRRGKLTKAQIEHAWATIERNAKLQAQLVEDLLDISRILRGKLSLNSSVVNLAATIQAAIETVHLAAQAKSIDLRFTICEFGLQDSRHPKPNMQHPKLEVLGDATRLQQVIWNLLSNAVKFTPEGGRVEINLSSVSRHSSSVTTKERVTHDKKLMTNYAQIRVSDTGIGISPNFLPSVFDYFRQSDSATTRRFGGLGLGLAIVRQLVEAHGGTVWAESSGEGQGATFTVRLPLLAAESTTTTDSPPSEAVSNLKGTQILVIDNESDALEFVAFVLEQAGASVIPAASADEALTLLSRSQPDVLLSDIGMPDMDGYMLMQQVRSLPPEQGGHVPAIALTAYAGDINYQKAISAGFQRHLAKPIEPGALIKAIADLIKQNQRQ
ncbi:hybrid sensor histidine kinase/response regulator [Oscillatoria sp. FACHB-1407]